MDEIPQLAIDGHKFYGYKNLAIGVSLRCRATNKALCIVKVMSDSIGCRKSYLSSPFLVLYAGRPPCSVFIIRSIDSRVAAG